MPPSKPRLLALLGDSILDNASYTHPEPDTAAHLRELLGGGWEVVLAARDGAVIAELPPQLGELTARPDVMVLSIGGNDALGHLDILTPRATTSTELLSLLQDIADDFEEEYARVLELLRPSAGRLIVCTIYEAPLSDPAMARLARVPLALLDDRIIRAAARAGAEVLELREVCTGAGDYVREIEPSAEGARKIAAAIAAAVLRRP